MINCTSYHLYGSPTSDILEPKMKSLSRQRIDGTHTHKKPYTRRVNRSASYKHNQVFPKIMSLDTDILICIIPNICSNLSRQ